MLLGNLAYHEALRTVIFKMGPPGFSMADSFSLPKLDCIELRFCLDPGFAQRTALGWLTKQPRQALRIMITVCSRRPSDHEFLVSQLQQLSIQRLYLMIHAQLCPEVQEMWSRVTVTQICVLHVGCSIAVQAVPRCPAVLFKACSLDPAKPAALSVTWAALASQPGRVQIHPQHDLHVLGGCALPAELNSQRWQVAVYSTESVHGLHGASRQGGVQYLQSQAARAAGWTV